MRCMESPRRERQSSMSVPPTIRILCCSGVGCDDRSEIERRLNIRRGRESEPECEASDWSVFGHLVQLWDEPSDERCGSNAVPVLSYDTRLDRLRWLRRATRSVSEFIEYALLRRPVGQRPGHSHRVTPRAIVSASQIDVGGCGRDHP